MDENKKMEIDFYYTVLDGERDEDGLRKTEHIKKSYMTIAEAYKYCDEKLKPKYDPDKYCIWFGAGEIINKSE